MKNVLVSFADVHLQSIFYFCIYWFLFLFMIHEVSIIGVYRTVIMMCMRQTNDDLVRLRNEQIKRETVRN